MRFPKEMKKALKNIVVLLIAVSLTAGPLFIALPQKAEAGAESCLGGIIAGYAKSKAAGAADMLGVPVNSMGISEATASTAGQTQGFTIQRCIVEPLVTTLARTLLSKFTAQTVNWINSGFKGSPLYVTNLQGFMTDVADQTIGTFIEGLGPIGEFFCSPFDLQLRLSLNLEYGLSGYQEEIGCRLTDIQNNVNRAFTSGVFGKNGWDNWLQITATPQNNPYGTYLKAVDSIDARIAGTQTIQLTQLGWGKGFLSSVNPDTGEIETPGSLIEDQLAETLGQQVRNVGLAKDLDAILNALVGQMINQVLGPGGLLGASSRSSSGQASAVDRGLYGTSEDILYQNSTAQKLPSGVLPIGQTEVEFCQSFRTNLYFRNTDETPNTIWFQQGTKGVDGTITYNPTKTPTFKKPGDVPWTIEDYNGIVNFCNNVDLTVPLNNATTQFNQDVSDSTSGETPYVPTEEPEQSRVISVADVTANQSYTQYAENEGLRTASNALTGTFGGRLIASTYGGNAPHWMTFTFHQNQTFGSIEITGYPGYSGILGPNSRTQGALISVYNNESDPAPFKHYITADEGYRLSQGQTISIDVIPAKTGNIVRIDNDIYYIFLTGIKFLRPSTGSATTQASATAELPITFALDTTANPAEIPSSGTLHLSAGNSLTTQNITVKSASGFINGSISFSVMKSSGGIDGPYDQKVTSVGSLISDAKVKFCPENGPLNCENTVNDFTTLTVKSISETFTQTLPSVPQSNNSQIRYKFTVSISAQPGSYKLIATMPNYSGALAEFYITIP